MFIYKATNKLNGKVFIGKTQDFTRRVSEHLYEAVRQRRISHFYHALRKDSDNFIWEILEECNEDEVNERERYWIHHFNSTDKNLGYNCTTGGDGGNITGNHPDKQRIYEQISQKLAGRKRDKSIRQRFIDELGEEAGAVRWREYRRYMGTRVSLALKGKPKSKEHLAKVATKLRGVPQSELARTRKTKAGRIIPADKLEEIKNAFLDGESINAIRLKFGYSHRKISKTLKELGLL